MTPAEIIAELRRQSLMRNATWPCMLLKDMMPLCDEFERLEAEIARRHGIGVEMVIARHERDRLQSENDRYRDVLLKRNGEAG